jgi:hypothetical protein
LPQGGLLNSYAIFYITVDTLLIDRYSREREKEKNSKVYDSIVKNNNKTFQRRSGLEKKVTVPYVISSLSLF